LPHEVAQGFRRSRTSRSLGEIRLPHYSINRSHIRLTSIFKGTEHHIAVPKHKPLKVGTLNSILTDIASYLEMEKQELLEKLFG
jgi:hypothetical protein